MVRLRRLVVSDGGARATCWRLVDQRCWSLWRLLVEALNNSVPFVRPPSFGKHLMPSRRYLTAVDKISSAKSSRPPVEPQHANDAVRLRRTHWPLLTAEVIPVKQS